MYSIQEWFFKKIDGPQFNEEPGDHLSVSEINNDKMNLIFQIWV